MIWPVDPVIAAGQTAVAVWVENRGTNPVTLQVRVLEWTQPSGTDVLSVQRAVVASPPISTIPSGQRQMVRLVSAQPAPPLTEVAYRVLLDELPAPEDMGTVQPPQADTGMGIRLNVRYAIPLFVYGGGARPTTFAKSAAQGSEGRPLLPSLTWAVVSRDGSRHRLLVRNEGLGHARLTAVQWSVATEAGPSAGKEARPPDITINPGLLGYVLAHSEMHWDLEQPAPSNAALRATVNGEEVLVPRGAQP
jgi:fimbrial chaperone protein